MSFTTFKDVNERRAALKKIAEATVADIERGSFLLNGVSHNLSTKIDNATRGTRYFAPDSLLSSWSSKPKLPVALATRIEISLLEISTLDGARYLSSNHGGKIGILNFASAKKPGGGFLSGDLAQEESIARSSTLYPTLMTSTAQKFYTLHNRDAKDGYYSHAMIYSPGIVIFRDDDGNLVDPLDVDVLTSPAVNAGVVRKSLRGRLAAKAEEDRIAKVMKERIARILFLFEKEGVKNIVLGSFGTGVFQNDVSLVATLWADFLGVQDARFADSFDHVVFAILGRKTFVEFEDTFNSRIKEDCPPVPV